MIESKDTYQKMKGIGMIHEKEQSNIRSDLKFLLFSIFLVATIYFSSCLVAVKGESMYPTYSDGQILVGLKVYDSIRHNDVVVINAPDANDLYIKRVIGLAGDEISIKNGIVYVNGNEETINVPPIASDEDTTLKVPEGHIFVMGDNRNNSKDSRVFGPVRKSEIVAVIFNSRRGAR